MEGWVRFDGLGVLVLEPECLELVPEVCVLGGQLPDLDLALLVLVEHHLVASGDRLDDVLNCGHKEWVLGIGGCPWSIGRSPSAVSGCLLSGRRGPAGRGRLAGGGWSRSG